MMLRNVGFFLNCFCFPVVAAVRERFPFTRLRQHTCTESLSLCDLLGKCSRSKWFYFSKMPSCVYAERNTSNRTYRQNF